MKNKNPVVSTPFYAIAGSAFVETVTKHVCGRVLESTIRPATKNDIELAQELHVKGNCPHNVVMDEAGWMFDFRSCHTCGKGLGVV